MISGHGLFAGLHQRVQLSVHFCGGESKGKLSYIHIYTSAQCVVLSAL